MSAGWSTVLLVFGVLVVFVGVAITIGNLAWAYITGERRLKWGCFLAAEIVIIMTVVATAIDASVPK